VSRTANLADEMLRRLRLGLVDGSDIPPLWDDIILYYSIGLDEREIDRAKNPNKKDYANGGKAMTKAEQTAWFEGRAKAQAARQAAAAREKEGQRARGELTGRS